LLSNLPADFDFASFARLLACRAAKEARETERKQKEEEERKRNAPMPKHCCLPDSLDW
jgi:hypothetical protein